MRAAGVNIFPAEDSYKYVQILDKVYTIKQFCLSRQSTILFTTYLNVPTTL